MNKRFISYISKAILLLGGIAFFVSCENDIETIKAITAKTNYPDVTGKNVYLAYTDSSKLVLEITAPEILQYDNVEKPYTDFPQGIHVKFYNESEELESEIKADKAIYFKNETLWRADQNVVGKNYESGERLYTDQLFWNEEKEIVYSDVFSRIETPDGTHLGQNGFEANQDMTSWVLKGGSGTMNVKDDDEQATTQAE